MSSQGDSAEIAAGAMCAETAHHRIIARLMSVTKEQSRIRQQRYLLADSLREPEDQGTVRNTWDPGS